MNRAGRLVSVCLLLGVGIAIGTVITGASAQNGQPQAAGPKLLEKMDAVYFTVQDLDAATKFYEEALGLRVTQKTPSWVEFDTGGTPLALMPLMDPRMKPGMNGIPIFRVKDVRQAMETLKAKGVTFMGDVIPIGIGDMAVFTDPDGNVMHMVQYTALPPYAEAGGIPSDVKEMAGTEEVRVKVTEPQLVAYTVHKGAYMLVGTAFARLGKWVEENGYEIAGPGITTYWNNPSDTKPEDLISEVAFVVRKK